MKLVLRLLLAAPVLLVACGGAPEAPRSPTSVEQDRDGVPDRAPSTIEEAQDQIAEAQQRLEGGDVDTRMAPGSTEAPSPPPPPPPSDPSGSAGAPAAPKDDATPADACMASCRAFASMRRAVEALCRMTGETDDRCAKARRTLGTSNGRVTACRCAR